MVRGLVQYRWMYRYERYMFHLKQFFGNKTRVEGPICKGYLNEDMSNFCCHYFGEDMDTKPRDLSRNVVSHNVTYSLDPNLPEIFCTKGLHSSNGKILFLNNREFHVAHLYVLRNYEILDMYECLFEQYIFANYLDVRFELLRSTYEDLYPQWFNKYVPHENVNNLINTLSLQTWREVKTWHIYTINGYKFYTHD